MNTKMKTPFAVFFENHPEFSDATKESYLHIEKMHIQSAYFTGKVQYDSAKTEEEFWLQRYE
jgi:hypothetical protein